MFRIGNRVFGSHRMPDVKTIGITNETEDCWFVPFLDYDETEYRVVLRDLLHLNRVFGLCSFVVLVTDEYLQDTTWDDGRRPSSKQRGNGETVGNYLVFGFDRLSYWDCMTAISHCRCDRLYRKIANTYSKRNWVIRLAAKYGSDGEEVRPEPRLKEFVKFDGFCRHEHSGSFVDLASEWYGVRIPLKNIVKDGKVEFIEYSTRKK